MRVLLLITLAACGAYAVPLPDGSSAVDLVPPRRVYTGSRAGPFHADAMAGFRSDFLRRLFGSGFPRLAPRADPNCDWGTFRLSDAGYSAVQQCQRSRSAEQDLRQCIMDVLPDDATEMKEFLDRDEYRITSMNFSLSIAVEDHQMTRSGAVTFQLCPPSDERNAVEEEEEEEPAYQPQRPSFPFRNGWMFGDRPTFQPFQPRPNPFFDFNAFKPIFDFKPTFPSFPNFDFDISDFPGAGYDPETCVKQTFQLPREQYVKARSCLGVSQSFKECLSEKLSEHEEAKELLRFVSAENTVVVDRRFFSSISSINGEVTRKNKIQLTHCEETEPEEEEAEEEGQEDQQEGEEATPQETTVQEETQLGGDFEP